MSESLRGGLMALTKKQIAEYAFDLQVGLEGIDVPEYDAAKAIGMAAVLAINLRAAVCLRLNFFRAQ
jgi:hypothetical protein